MALSNFERMLQLADEVFATKKEAEENAAEFDGKISE